MCRNVEGRGRWLGGHQKQPGHKPDISRAIPRPRIMRKLTAHGRSGLLFLCLCHPVLLDWSFYPFSWLIILSPLMSCSQISSNTSQCSMISSCPFLSLFGKCLSSTETWLWHLQSSLWLPNSFSVVKLSLMWSRDRGESVDCRDHGAGSPVTAGSISQTT